MNIYYIAGGAALAGLILELVIFFFFFRMLSDAGATRENHHNEEIPVGIGVSFPATVIIVFLGYAILQRYLQWPIFNVYYLVYIFGVLGMAILGFGEDMLGSRENLGLRAQIRALIQGRITTRALKAVGGLVIAVFVAFLTTELWWDWLLNALIIFLFANLMNLLELRPGRASIGFILFWAAIVMISLGQIDYILIAPLSGALLAYLPYDLKTRAMMGDAGANVLGFSLGFWAACGLSLSARVAMLLFLIVMHLFAERYSLSEVITNDRLFTRMDESGS